MKPDIDTIVARMRNMERIERMSRPGRVGDSQAVKPFAGGHYVDTILSIEPWRKS